MSPAGYDAVVVGAGPNGLAAAITLARAGRSVLVLEGEPTVGGGTRTEALTLPGFLHDVCSAVHPMAVASPFFRSLPAERYERLWVQPPIPLAHPFDDGEVACLERTILTTAAYLGADSRSNGELIAPLVTRAEALLEGILRPLRLPRRPLLLARFGVEALRSCRGLVERRFHGAAARALFAGCAAHSTVDLEQAGTAAFGLVLLTTEALQGRNPNLVGGDISGEANHLRQLLARPALRLDPYSTPHQRLYICSSSTPPGGGVHGMCGHLAAHSALRRALR